MSLNRLLDFEGLSGLLGFKFLVLIIKFIKKGSLIVGFSVLLGLNGLYSLALLV